MSKTDFGSTVITVDDENSFKLNFNLKAVKAVEKAFGGIVPCLQELQRCTIGAAVQVIKAGSGITLKPKEEEALEEAIFIAGIANVNPDLIRYVGAMLNPRNAKPEEIEAETAAKGNE